MADSKIPLGEMTTEQLLLEFKAAPSEEASAYCEELITRFEPLLRRGWQPYEKSEYQDFVQDVFVRMFGGLHQLRNPKAFPGYFKSIVFSVAARRWRKKQLAVKTSEEDIDRVFTRTHDALITRIFVRSYLEHLPDRERQIIKWLFLEDWSIGEIAKKLNLEPSAVRAAKTRALKRLRGLLLADAKALEDTFEKK